MSNIQQKFCQRQRGSRSRNSRVVRGTLDSQDVLGGQISVQTGNLEFAIFGTNLTNKEYSSGQDGDNEFYSAPRQYGARLKVTF